MRAEKYNIGEIERFYDRNTKSLVEKFIPLKYIVHCVRSSRIENKSWWSFNIARLCCNALLLSLSRILFRSKFPEFFCLIRKIFIKSKERLFYNLITVLRRTDAKRQKRCFFKHKMIYKKVFNIKTWKVFPINKIFNLKYKIIEFLFIKRNTDKNKL